MRKVFHIEKNEFVLAHPDAETVSDHPPTHPRSRLLWLHLCEYGVCVAQAVWCDFEYCYGETERQSAVYKDFGAPMLAYTLAGYNTVHPINPPPPSLPSGE